MEVTIKKAKVTLAEYRRKFDTKFGTIHVHIIVFDNKDKGEYHSKSEHQDKFIVSRETSYSIEWQEKENKDHSFFKIKPYDDELVKNTGNNQNSTKMYMTPEQSKKITAINCSIDFASALLIDDKKLMQTAIVEFSKWLTESNPGVLDPIKQACLKSATNAVNVKVLGINDVATVLQTADKYVKYVIAEAK